jgi:hypothetical protein
MLCVHFRGKVKNVLKTKNADNFCSGLKIKNPRPDPD